MVSFERQYPSQELISGDGKFWNVGKILPRDLGSVIHGVCEAEGWSTQVGRAGGKQLSAPFAPETLCSGSWLSVRLGKPRKEVESPWEGGRRKGLGDGQGSLWH